MYQDEKVSINWFKMGLRLVIIILIVFLVFKLVSMLKDNKTNVIENNEMKEKFNLIDEAAKKYFTNELLPKEPGSSVTITLQELIDKDFIGEIKDDKDKTCDAKVSNVKVTKLDNEYQYKTTLKCDTFEDYNNTFVEIKENNNNKPTTTIPVTTTKTMTTKKIKTTKKVTTTTTKKYKVSFNTNGGTLINDQTVNANQTIVSPGVPRRDGYKFVGWFYHGTKFDMTTKINQDYVLTAKWIKE